jgi:hypothetical protein
LCAASTLLAFVGAGERALGGLVNRRFLYLILGGISAGCGGPTSGGPLSGGNAGPPGVGGPAPSPTGLACADIFKQDQVGDFAFDIAADEWSKLVAEFNDLTDLQAGLPFAAYHPIVFHAGAETVTDAAVKLHGQSSWLQTVMFDGDKAKMQFDVAFDQINPMGSFHGVSKLVFDMPRSDWTFLHDRLAHTWLRQVGVLASCTSSARLTINGARYGLYVLEESVGHRVVEEFFPSNGNGDLWKGGIDPETNTKMPDWARQKAFWAAGDLDALGAIVDIKSSLTSWAAEALINDSDGYYGGSHNFYLYDQGPSGFVFLPSDTDSTFDWLALFDLPAFDDHPIFFWQTRAAPAPLPGPQWVTVMNDPGWRKKYADAIAALLAKWSVADIQGYLATWSAQIAADVAADPHAWAKPSDFSKAVSTAHDVIAERAQYLQTFVDCENGHGEDRDGDGARWCDDCRDDDATIHVGAPELCNGVDDNCNGTVDEGCP